MRTKVTVHENSVTLRIDDVKLIASEPEIQPFNTYIYKSPKDIMYFYYTLRMMQKQGSRWREIASTRVFEFGIMNHIEEHIDKILKLNTKKEGIRQYFQHRDSDGNMVTSKNEFIAVCPCGLEGMFEEDAMLFTKYYKTFYDMHGRKEFEYYDLNLMIGGNELGKSAVGAYFTGLHREDLECIREFAKEFMRIANEETKARIERYLTNDEESPYNDPKLVRDCLRKEHGITDWRPIFLKLSQEEYVLDEYIEYITGEKTEDELRCHEWHGEKRTMKQMLKVMPAHEAYMHIIDDNRRRD